MKSLNDVQAGLSLVEIMISMVILSILIYATVSLVNQNQRIKAGVDEEYALTHEVRAAVSVVEEDISQLFILPPRFNLQDKQAIHDALFTGSSDKLSGVTFNYQKRVLGQRDTHVREVEYYLTQEETDRPGEVAYSLMRKLTSFLDAELFGEGVNYAVLTDLKSWKFSYFDDMSKNWIESWDSREGETKARLPKAVAVHFEVYQRNPDDPNAEPMVIAFETKFLADAWIEKKRVFELSKSVQQAKEQVKQLQSGEQSPGKKSGKKEMEQEQP